MLNYEDLVRKSDQNLRTIVQLSGLSADVVLGTLDGDEVSLDVVGDDAALLVGPHGQTLDALQFLLLLMTNKQRDQRLRLSVDADGYRKRRTQVLTDFAETLAAQVLKTGQEAITDPLNAMERRIVHNALTGNPDVRTYSEGDDPDRVVVISPREKSAE